MELLEDSRDLAWVAFKNTWIHLNILDWQQNRWYAVHSVCWLECHRQEMQNTSAVAVFGCTMYWMLDLDGFKDIIWQLLIFSDEMIFLLVIVVAVTVRTPEYGKRFHVRGENCFSNYVLAVPTSSWHRSGQSEWSSLETLFYLQSLTRDSELININENPPFTSSSCRLPLSRSCALT